GAARAAVRRGVTGALGAGPPADPIALAFWLELLGAPDPSLAPSELAPEARRARLFQLLRGLIETRARRELMVLWIEDLQWLDSADEPAIETVVAGLLAPGAAGRQAPGPAPARPAD